MKKLFTLILLFISSVVFVNAQSREMTSISKIKDSFANRHAGSGNTSQALWDVQLQADLVPINVVSVVYTGTEFWVGRYTTDTMYTLDNTGTVTSTFVVTGVGTGTNGIRGLTYDGTNIFATVGTDKKIYKINPVTKTLVSSVTASTVAFNLRGIAFDSTANAGAGGFWVSAFNSDFVLVSRTGAILQTIPLATHTLVGVYGIAFDPYTAGGPYLWAHDQEDGTQSKIKRVKISTGMLDGPNHDINVDFGSAAIAGSLSITWRYQPGSFSIIGIGQQAPSLLFAYELNDFLLPSVDASADSIVFNPPYTIIPISEIVPYSWDVKSTNNGAAVITDLSSSFRLTDSIIDYFAPPAVHNNNVASLASVSNNFGPFTPAMGFYYMQAAANTSSQTDNVPNNDTLTVPFLSVEDSTYARDNSVGTGSLGIGDGTGGTIGQYFTLTQPAVITSATFLLNGPTEADFTSVDLYDMSGGLPANILASSDFYTFTAADTNGVVLTLPFLTPYLAAPGDYFLGVNEHTANVTLATTGFNYHPNTGFVTFTAQAWAPSESFGFKRTYVLRLNIDPTTVGVNAAASAASQFSVFPNPSTGKVYVHNPKGEDCLIQVYNNMGQLVYERASSALTSTLVDLGSYANGVYHVFVKSSSSTYNTSVVISHE
jgi:hypothetical protein